MMSALLQASVSHLMRNLGLPAASIGVSHDKRPPIVLPDNGFYVALYGVANNPDERDLNTGLDMICDIGITITKRLRFVPYDDQRRSEMYLEQGTISNMLWRCIAWLHQEFEVTSEANRLLNNTVSGADGFTEPLRYISCDPMPEVVNESWFIPEMSEGAPRMSATYPLAGMRMEALLGGARRIVHIDKLRAEGRFL